MSEYEHHYLNSFLNNLTNTYMYEMIIKQHPTRFCTDSTIIQIHTKTFAGSLGSSCQINARFSIRSKAHKSAVSRRAASNSEIKCETLHSPSDAYLRSKPMSRSYGFKGHILYAEPINKPSPHFEL